MSDGGERPIRFRCDLEAELHWGGAAHPVRVLDLSDTGAFIETDLFLNPGEHGVLRIHEPDLEPLAVPVIIARLATGQREIHDPRAKTLTVARAGAAVTFVSTPAGWTEHMRALRDRLADS